MGDSLTVAEAMASVAQDDKEYWTQYRAALMSQLTAVERYRLGMQMTSADIVRWFRARGPDEDVAMRQLAHIKECNRS